MSSFRILGPIEAGIGEQGLALGGPTQVKLLAFLLLHANQAVSNDALTGALWGAERSGSANRLAMAVARLRKALTPLTDGVGRVRTVGGGYMLSVESGELDADEFVRLVEDGREASVGGDAERCAELLGSALALWRGPPLAEVAFEDFAQAEIRRLEELRLEALEARIQAELELGRHSQVVGELEGLLAEDATREGMASQLMLAYYRCGRQADALEVYQRTRGHLAGELGLEPGPAIKSLQTRILEQAPSLELRDAHADPVDSTTRSRAVPLPLLTTPTIGRERDVEEVCGLLAGREVRLVTLTGPGGVGKTRLALAAARQVVASFEGGARWVELAGVTGADEVGSTIARALAVTPLQGEDPQGALSRYLAGKRLLLVIDNFEHVIGAAGLIGEVLEASEGVTVLVTSREALDLRAEHRFVVAPLRLPAISGRVTLAEVEATAATALFLDTARRRDRRLAVTEAQAPVLARICSRLDGLPLALELAAGRTAVLGIDELEVGLASMIDLGAGPRDAPARQRTLAATIDWSYRLLDEDQQRTFARYAVFAGGATVDAALAVTGGSLEVLEGLLAKNLLARRVAADGATRLVMLETVRAFALDRFDTDPRRDAIRDAHLDYYLEFVEANVPRLATHEELTALRRLDDEADNIRSALRWALEAAPLDALRLAGHLGDYWWIGGDPDGLAWLDAALQAAGQNAPAADRARALLKRAYQLAYRHQVWAACDAGEAALQLYTEIGDHAGISDACRELVFFHQAHGNSERAIERGQHACEHARLAGDDALLGRALAKNVHTLPAAEGLAALEQAAELLTPLGDWRPVARGYINLGYLAITEGRHEDALELLDVALRAVQNSVGPAELTLIWGNIGLANIFLGHLPRAQSAFVRQLGLCIEQAYERGADEGLAGVAAIEAKQGSFERSARLLGAAHAMGYPGPGAEDRTIADRLERDFFAAARDAYGSDAWRRAETAGAALSYEQAIAAALDDANKPVDAPSSRLEGPKTRPPRSSTC